MLAERTGDCQLEGEPDLASSSPGVLLCRNTTVSQPFGQLVTKLVAPAPEPVVIPAVHGVFRDTNSFVIRGAEPPKSADQS